MTETDSSNPQKLWKSLSDTEQEAVMAFGVSDWRTGVGKDYIDAMILHGFRFASPVVSYSSTISDRPVSCFS